MRNKSYFKNYFLAGLIVSLFCFAPYSFAQNLSLQDMQKEAQLRSQKTKEQVNKVRQDSKEISQEPRQKALQVMQKIKDNSKKQTAVKISEQFDRINKVWTDHFINVLEKLDDILQKIKSREQGLQTGDLNNVTEAIEKAEAAIEKARFEVVIQAQKDYVLNSEIFNKDFSGESGQENLYNMLKIEFQKTKEKMFFDLKSLRDGAMKEARESVLYAFSVLVNNKNSEMNQ